MSTSRKIIPSSASLPCHRRRSRCSASMRSNTASCRWVRRRGRRGRQIQQQLRQLASPPSGLAVLPPCRWPQRQLDNPSLKRLVQRNAPQFLPTWRRLCYGIMQIDIARVVWLLAHGGIYADLDTDDGGAEKCCTVPRKRLHRARCQRHQPCTREGLHAPQAALRHAHEQLLYSGRGGPSLLVGAAQLHHATRRQNTCMLRTRNAQHRASGVRVDRPLCRRPHLRRLCGGPSGPIARNSRAATGLALFILSKAEGGWRKKAERAGAAPGPRALRLAFFLW